MEYEYPPQQHLELTWRIIALHVVIVAFALAPLFGLLVQTRRPVRKPDAWLWLACLVLLPIPFLAAYRAYPGYPRPFLLGLFFFAEAVVALAGLLTLFRLARQGHAVHASLVLGSLLALAALVALLLPAVPSAREAAERTQCANQLKNIILAVHVFHDANNSLPPAVTSDANEFETSWRVTLLPYLDETQLYQQYDQSRSWDAEPNVAVARREPRLYRCPSNEFPMDGSGRYYTAYAMMVGADAAFARDGSKTLADASAGTSNTVAFVEACGRNIIWTKPEDVAISKTPAGVNLPGESPGLSRGALSSMHPSGAQAAMLDGSVRFLHAGMDPRVLRQLLSASQRPDAGQ